VELSRETVEALHNMTQAEHDAARDPSARAVLPAWRGEFIRRLKADLARAEQPAPEEPELAPEKGECPHFRKGPGLANRACWVHPDGDPRGSDWEHDLDSRAECDKRALAASEKALRERAEQAGEQPDGVFVTMEQVRDLCRSMIGCKVTGAEIGLLTGLALLFPDEWLAQAGEVQP
jgi:hypothetical protein